MDTLLNHKADSLKANIENKPNKIDTLNHIKDSLKSENIKPSSGDSVPTDSTKRIKVNTSDTAVRYFLAFHHVRIFSDSMQSVCDSLYFSASDSVFRLFKDPIVWSGQSQINGDTMFLFTKNKKAERLHVFEKGMVINKSKSELYNQVAGKTINGYFKNGVIDHARIRGQKA